MKILKLLNNLIIYLIISLALFISNVLGNEPVDIWELKNNESKKKI